MRATRIAALFLVPVVTLGSTFFVSQSVNSFVEKKVEEPEFFAVSAEKSLGSTWLDNFFFSPPFEGNEFTQNENWAQVATERTLVSDPLLKCAQIQPMPPFVLDAKTFSTGVVSVSAITTHAGLARSLVNDFESRALECGFSFSRDENKKFSLGNSTRIFFYGDAAVSVFLGNGFVGDREQVFSQVEESFVKTLTESGCKNVDPKVDDRRRNIFYTTGNEPEGLFVTEKIHTEEDTVNLPTLVESSLVVINFPNLQKPEGPYPKDFPDIPGEKVEKPTIPPFPQLTNGVFEKDVTFEVPDFEGAGCGWQWAVGVEAPNYDITQLNNVENVLKQQALDEVNVSARDYINNYLNTLGGRAVIQPSVVRWNNYANTVNDVHNQWNSLENGRKQIKPNYETYVDSWNMWATFDGRKSIEQELFDRRVRFCRQRDEDFMEWQRDGGESVAPRPALCSSIDRPTILDENNVGEPTFEVPESLTIPDSWRKPGGDVLQKIIDDEKARAEASYNDMINRFAVADENNRRQWVANQQRTSRSRSQLRESFAPEFSTQESFSPSDSFANNILIP